MTQAEGGGEPLALAAHHGIHRLAIPTPFAVGRVNCYLIEDVPLTLVDTGPNSGKSLDELELALSVHGRRIEDLELVVISHQHVDHLGLGEIIARRSGAETAALSPLAPYLADFAASAAAEDKFAAGVMRVHGIPADLVTVLGALGASFRAFGSSPEIACELRTGDVITLRDRQLEVLHRPGHSPSDIILWDAERQILLAGDHLLAHISSNPLIAKPLPRSRPGLERTHAGDGTSGDAAEQRPRALLDYIESLRGTRALPARLVLSGHGEPIVDHVSLIDERLRLHERRARKIASLLTQGPLTAHEISLQMWGEAALTQAYLVLSEVLGHLDLLVADGRVQEASDGELVRFELTAH